jgi:hypothetical protein
MLQEWLKNEKEFTVGTTILKQRFKQWGVQRRPPAHIQDHIKGRIFVLFFEQGLEDIEIRQVLAKEGFPIGKYTLYRMRHEMCLHRRLRDPTSQKEAEQHIQEIVQEEMKKGPIDGYGKQFIYLHFRQKYHILARDRLFKIYKELNPEGVARRGRDAQNRKGEYIVPGPNWIWSIDGHEKLKPYGIEIYACIDAYSRYVIWIYVGISAGTAVSVFWQYMTAIDAAGIRPESIRSDCGNETAMVAYAHYMLCLQGQPDASFEDCYMYGTSTANQRIESWWHFLSKGLLFRWRVSASLFTITGLLLDYYWTITGLLLDYYWTITGLLLDYY